MATSSVTVRFSVQDAEVVRKALEDMGKDGDAALHKLDASSRQPSAALSGLSGAVAGIKDRFIGLGVSMGPVGTALIAMGPAGILAAGALSLTAAAIGHMIAEADRLASKAQDLRTFSEVSGLTATQLQTLEKAGAELGITADDVKTKVERFAVQLATVRTASGPLYDQILKVDSGIAQQIVRTKDNTAAWNLLAQAYEKTTEKAALANAAGGRGAAGVLGPLLGLTATSGGLDQLLAKVGQVGILTEDQVRAWAKAKAQIDSTNEAARVLMASIWTPEVLARQREAADIFLRIAERARELSELSPSQSWIDWFIRIGQAGADMPATGAEWSDAEKKANALAAAVGRLKALMSGAMAGQSGDFGPWKDFFGDLPKGKADAQALFNEMQRWMSAVGAAATPTEQYDLAILKLNATLGLSKEQYDRARAALELHRDATITSARERLGVASQEEIELIRLRQIEKDYSDGVIKSAQERALAEQMVRKEAKLTAEQLQVRASLTPQLTALSIEAGNLERQLDSGLASSLRSSAGDFADVTMGTKTFSEGLKSLETNLARAILQMIWMKTVVKPLADSLSGLLGSGGLLGMLRIGSPGASPGAPGMHAGEAHTGGIVGGPMTIRMAPSAIFAHAPRFHEGGLLPGERPIIARDGEGIFTPAQMRALGNGAGGGNVVVNKIDIHNHAPGVEVVQREKPDRSGFDLIVKHIGAQLADDIARKQGPLHEVISAKINRRDLRG